MGSGIFIMRSEIIVDVIVLLCYVQQGLVLLYGRVDPLETLPHRFILFLEGIRMVERRDFWLAIDGRLLEHIWSHCCVVLTAHARVIVRYFIELDYLRSVGGISVFRLDLDFYLLPYLICWCEQALLWVHSNLRYILHPYSLLPPIPLQQRLVLLHYDWWGIAVMQLWHFQLALVHLRFI